MGSNLICFVEGGKKALVFYSRHWALQSQGPRNHHALNITKLWEVLCSGAPTGSPANPTAERISLPPLQGATSPSGIFSILKPRPVCASLSVGTFCFGLVCLE